jgi:hypothetical protein
VTTVVASWRRPAKKIFLQPVRGRIIYVALLSIQVPGTGTRRYRARHALPVPDTWYPPPTTQHTTPSAIRNTSVSTSTYHVVWQPLWIRCPGYFFDVTFQSQMRRKLHGSSYSYVPGTHVRALTSSQRCFGANVSRTTSVQPLAKPPRRLGVPFRLTPSLQIVRLVGLA